MNAKTNSLLFFTLFLLINTSQGMGVGDWSSTTKNSTKFDDPGGGITITLSNGKQYKYIDEWYFYKDHIVGKTKEYINYENKYEYFVLNEITGKIHTFQKKDAWEIFIKSNNLNPKYWKRSFRDNWNHSEMMMLIPVLWFPISIPFIFLNLYFFKRLFEFEKNWTKWAFLSAISPLFILAISILGKFPDSF